MAKMPKSSTKLSPIKATASPAAQGIVRTSSCDRDTAPKDDARARAASPEARKMAAGALSSTAGSRPGSQPIDIGLYRPMLSTERDPPPHRPTHLSTATVMKGKPPSSARSTTNTNATAGPESVINSGGLSSPSKDSQPRALLISHRTGATTTDRIMDRTTEKVTATARASVGRAALWLGFLGGTFILLLFLGACVLIHSHRAVVAETCVTEDCLVHANMLKDILNTSVDPCHDFSAYVCSRWVPKHTPFRDNIRSVMDDLRYSWYAKFRETLRRGSLTLNEGKKPLAMYDMCVSGTQSSTNATKIPLIVEFEHHLPPKWRGFSNASVSTASFALWLAYKWQSPLWLSVDVFSGRTSFRVKRRVVVKPGTYAPIFLAQHRKVMGFYNQYIKAYVAAVFPQRNSSTPGLSDALIAEIRDMETDVLEQFNSVFEQRKQAASFSFGEFDAMVANNQSTIKGGWFKSFEAGLLLHPQLTPEDELLLSHAPLLGILARLVEKYGDVNMKYLLMWEFIQLYFPLSNLSLLATRFGSERKADVERPIYCAHHVEASFKVLLLSLGVVAHFSAELRNSIDARFDGLVAMAVKKVKSSAWFGADSKLQIANKLALVSKRMWPPKSLLVQKNLERIYADVFGNGKSVAEFWIQAHEVMLKPRATKAFEEASRLLGNYLPLYVDYDYALNSVKVATATVAPPSYYSNGTLSMFYGGLGFLMAMQLVKSIDGEGLRWTDDGSLVESILPNNSRRAYDDKVSCLGAPEENIFPEIPALEITYSSFKEATLRGEPDLALSSELTSGKVFFLTICYMTCTEAGYYNPMAADCNKLVRNSAYFAETYECPKGSSMNPERKCSFFS